MLRREAPVLLTLYRILSRKRDHEPGIGLESMRAICEKHDAVMDIRYDAKTFNVLLMIPVKN